jgi:hypothetical protein
MQEMKYELTALFPRSYLLKVQIEYFQIEELLEMDQPTKPERTWLAQAKPREVQRTIFE